MKKIEAKIIADSLSPQGHRITSYLLTYPRFIHSELMTHRMFSRNSASSRAIPFEKMVKMVEEDPFIPIAWQKDHKGMQGIEYLDFNVPSCTGKWLRARSQAVRFARELNAHGVTKQLCNRLLEPFMWTTMLITGSKEGWDNFFELRCPQYQFSTNPNHVYKSWRELQKAHNNIADNSLFNRLQTNKGQAEIHMMALAEKIYDAMNESTPKQLKEGEWHIPFGDRMQDKDIMQHVKGSFNSRTEVEEAIQKFKIKIATARCARLSYMTFDREIDYEKDFKLHDRLLSDGHMSPFEHCARAMNGEEYDSFIKGQIELGLDTSCGGWGGPPNTTYHPHKENRGWCNNFRGFIPYRYLIEK